MRLPRNSARSASSEPMKEKHITVLLHETVDGLTLKSGDTAIDATLGLGGHSEALSRIVGPTGTVLGIDADSEALALAKKRLKDAPARMRYALGNFRDISRHAHDAGITRVNGVVYDLGWNALQLEAGRGFSFTSADPLVMTYASPPGENAVTAHRIVNTWSESDLTEMLRTLGEERFASRIAKGICEGRALSPITTADELAHVVAESVPVFYRRRKIHPATKTFQAIRMMVNDELSSLSESLQEAFALLAPSGRIAVITFHSLEDALVKRAFKSFAAELGANIITKKPLVPSAEEIAQNPRARSGKLRIVEKQ